MAPLTGAQGHFGLFQEHKFSLESEPKQTGNTRGGEKRGIQESLPFSPCTSCLFTFQHLLLCFYYDNGLADFKLCFLFSETGSRTLVAQASHEPLTHGHPSASASWVLDYRNRPLTIFLWSFFANQPAVQCPGLTFQEDPGRNPEWFVSLYNMTGLSRK